MYSIFRIRVESDFKETCKLCEQGYFCEGARQAPQKCAIGTISNVTGAKSIDECATTMDQIKISIIPHFNVSFVPNVTIAPNVTVIDPNQTV